MFQCLSNETLHTICKIQAFDFDHSGGGVPDLIIWNTDKGEASFVEVKGPGDTLSETQKVYFNRKDSCSLLIIAISFGYITC